MCDTSLADAYALGLSLGMREANGERPKITPWFGVAGDQYCADVRASMKRGHAAGFNAVMRPQWARVPRTNSRRPWEVTSEQRAQHARLERRRRIAQERQTPGARRRHRWAVSLWDEL